MTELGWFSDKDERPEGQVWCWQPFLQLDGHVVSMEVWLDTEEACDRFIAEGVIGKGMLP